MQLENSPLPLNTKYLFRLNKENGKSRLMWARKSKWEKENLEIIARGFFAVARDLDHEAERDDVERKPYFIELDAEKVTLNEFLDLRQKYLDEGVADVTAVSHVIKTPFTYEEWRERFDVLTEQSHRDTFITPIIEAENFRGETLFLIFNDQRRYQWVDAEEANGRYIYAKSFFYWNAFPEDVEKTQDEESDEDSDENLLQGHSLPLFIQLNAKIGRNVQEKILNGQNALVSEFGQPQLISTASGELTLESFNIDLLYKTYIYWYAAKQARVKQVEQKELIRGLGR